MILEMKFLTFSKERVFAKLIIFFVLSHATLLGAYFPTIILNAFYQSCRALYAMTSVGEFV
jgi:hypothetical protein